MAAHRLVWLLRQRGVLDETQGWMPWPRRRRCCRRCRLRLFKVNWPLARVPVVGCVVCSRIRPQGSAAGSCVFRHGGFLLHAATRIGAEDRSDLGRLCR